MIMFLEKILICFLMLIIIPFILGKSLVLICKIRNSSLMEIVYGWLFVLASFEVIAVPATFLGWSLTRLCTVFSIFLFLVVIACIGYIIYNITNTKKNAQIVKKKFVFKWNIYVICSIVLVVFQLIIAIIGMHTDSDDAYYLGTTTTSLVTDTIYVYQPDNGLLYSKFPYRYVFSALTLLWAYFCKLSGIHPLVLTHTIIPSLFITFFYLIMWSLAKKIFKDYEKVSLFFLLINVFQIFGFTSVYTQPAFLLLRIWQGKSMLPNIIFPVLMGLFLELDQKKNKKTVWIMVFITVIAGCCCSSMGVPLCLLSVGVGTIVLLLRQRKWQICLWGILCCIPCFLIGSVFLVLR